MWISTRDSENDFDRFPFPFLELGSRLNKLSSNYPARNEKNEVVSCITDWSRFRFSFIIERKVESLNFSFYLASREIKEENLETLPANIDILFTGLDVCHIFEIKVNLTDPTVWNNGETGDIYLQKLFSSITLITCHKNLSLLISTLPCFWLIIISSLCWG